MTERNLKHIIDGHSKEIGSAEKVFEFPDDVFENATILRTARGRAMFVIVENTKTDKAAIIKLMPSDSGDYYNVELAGYYRKNKWKDTEEVIAELSEPTQSDAATDTSKPQNPQIDGREKINTKAHPFSDGKDNTNVLKTQGKSEENDKGVKRAQNDALFTIKESSKTVDENGEPRHHALVPRPCRGGAGVGSVISPSCK